jgi:predicted permease
MGNLLQELRYAIRQQRKSVGFTLVCAVTLALGVGANTAVFRVMNAVLLRSLPVADPQRVVYLRTSNPPRRTGTIDSQETFSYPVYEALRRNHAGLTDVMAYASLATGKVAVRAEGAPEEAEGDMVSGNYFSGLGVKVARGRGFTDQDEASHAPVAVISWNYWTWRFSRSPEVLGKAFYVNGVAMTIVGVAGEGFEGTDAGSSTDFWVPLQDAAELNVLGNPLDDGKNYRRDPTWWCLRLIGRLAPGVTKEQAAERLQGEFQAAAYVGLGNPEAGEKRPVLSMVEAKSFPGYDAQYGRPLRMLMAMVGLVLLIAVSNVAMLLMARNATRQREFSLRMALGARSGALFRQLLTESLLLVAMGGGLAWMFANAATKALGAWAQIETSLAADNTVLLLTLGVLILAALLFGLAPLRVALAAGPGLVLKTSAAASNSDASRSRTGRAIVALQMAFCLVLLVGGGLLVRTLQNLKSIPLGFSTEGLVVFGVNPKVPSLPEGVRFYRELMGKLRGLPGVESVTVMGDRLGSGWSSNNSMLVDGRLTSEIDGGPGRCAAMSLGRSSFTRWACRC